MKWALSYVVEADYLKVMGIPLERGRFLTPQDNERSSPVIVIDDQFARRHFGDRDPIGRRINLDILNITAEIVGVVGHVRQWGLDEEAASPIRRSAISRCSRFRITSCLSPPGTSPWCSGPPMLRWRRSARFGGRWNRSTANWSCTASRRWTASSPTRLATRRFSMIVLGVFAALALLMACVGIYGVISHLVGERTHEIAIRMALGAERRDVLRTVLRDGAKMALAGVAIGLGARSGAHPPHDEHALRHQRARSSHHGRSREPADGRRVRGVLYPRAARHSSRSDGRAEKRLTHGRASRKRARSLGHHSDDCASLHATQPR